MDEIIIISKEKQKVITKHSELEQLDYEEAKHKGFASEEYVRQHSGGLGSDEKVKYSLGTTAGYLSDVTKAGTGISLTQGTGADSDKLIIAATGSQSQSKIWSYFNGL